MAQAGLLHLPAAPELAYEFLDEWRTIQHYGVEVGGLRYNGPALDGYRNAASPYGGRHPGKWPVRVNPDDVRWIYFHDPDGGSGTGWSGSTRRAGTPFSAEAARYARQLAARQAAGPIRAALPSCWPGGTRAWPPGGGSAGWRPGWPPNAPPYQTQGQPQAESHPGRSRGPQATPKVMTMTRTRSSTRPATSTPTRSKSLSEQMLYSLSRKEGWRRYVEAPAQRPAPLTAGQLARLGDAAREDYDEARHDWHANFGILRTPQLAAVHDELEVIVAAGRCDPDRVRGAAVIDALPGLGKTTAANSFARGFDRDQIRRHGPLTGEGHERIPVFRVGLTSNTTLRTLNRVICEFYGHPGAGRASAAQLASQAVDCVLSCESRIGIIDDLHFIDPRRKDGLDVSNHLNGWPTSCR